MRPRVLSIAGVDPSGGAGIIADIKSISAFGGYAMGTVASLTAQNTKGVQSVQAVSAQFLGDQLNSISDDIEIDAVKIGLLSAKTIDVVGEWLQRVQPKNVVLDPVMIATSGDRLLDEIGEQKLKELARYATVVTPNLPELAVWTASESATDINRALEQAKALQQDLGCTVILKLGHLPDSSHCISDGEDGVDKPTKLLASRIGKKKMISDYVVSENAVVELRSKWVDSHSTHGTGCSLSSALATILTYTNGNVVNSLQIAKSWLSSAIANGKNLAVGGKNTADSRISHGPIDHFTNVAPSDFVHIATLLTQDIEAEIASMPFICSLTDGTLPKAQFANYLLQDNLYLEVYREVIAKLAKLANNSADAAFLSSLAGEEIDQEIVFHNKWLEENGFLRLKQSSHDHPQMSTATKEYTDFLLKAVNSGDLTEGLVAVLPCILIYTRIAQQITLQNANAHRFANHEDLSYANRPENPYQMWIDFYNAPENDVILRRLVDIVNHATKAVSREQFNHLITVYRRAARLEIDFFRQ